MMNEDSLALFAEIPPADAIQNSLALLEVLRENYSLEDADHGVWLQLGIIGDSIRSAVARMN